MTGAIIISVCSDLIIEPLCHHQVSLPTAHQTTNIPHNTLNCLQESDHADSTGRIKRMGNMQWAAFGITLFRNGMKPLLI